MKKIYLSIIVVVVFLVCSCGNQDIMKEEQVSKYSEELTFSQNEKDNQEEEYILVNWEQVVEKFAVSDSFGIVRNLRDLAWLAPRSGLNIELVAENITEEDDTYILESTRVLSDAENQNINETENVWLRIVQEPVELKEGTSVSGNQDILVYRQGEDAYIAIQSVENTKVWTLWKIPKYGDWLYKEIAIFMRVKTGL